ncbi:PSD1 and planctomycete cytochrome C domain-containing protein [Prosthecobacter sp.]|uniref:PSD1 and planctomycete cytochrome C domain-containing protein n=1 Tax=Prosthecobacter sp. TaxID=1965333 RepID=UPI00378334DE
MPSICCRPILSDNCFYCHGPDKNHRKGDLRLDAREELIKLGPQTLIERITTTDADDLMPPADSHKKLSSKQKDTLKQWIAEGAKYELHWAFVPPVKPKSGNSIDDFIRAELRRKGLQPAPRAPLETLIRRLSLDLTGLPPMQDNQTRREADKGQGSLSSYEQQVDALLASQHYGEHMAVDWLDAARFADTNGYQVDRDRELWPWRDWVIKAFNANMPFDQFTIEQIAGDLLPDATLDQKIATGFHRNHMLNEEGGIIAEEFLAEYTADRVETTAAVWLGQTFNCARCHDHKFDPFTQRDFYAMKAFFHNVPEKGVGLYSNPIRTNAPPFVKLPAPESEAQITALNAKLKPVEDKLKGLAASDLEPWAKRLAATKIDWQPLDPLKATGGDNPPQIADKAVLVGPQETRANNIVIKTKLPAGKVTAMRLECSTTAPSASFQWSGLNIGKSKLHAIDAAHASVLDNDRKTRSVLSVAPNKPVQALFELASPLEGSEVVITIGVENAGGPSQWRLYATTSAADLIAPASVVTIAEKEPARRTTAERKQLMDFRLAQMPEHRRLSEEAAALKKQIAAAEAEIPTTLVMEEQKEMRPTFILTRGAYDKPGEKVTAATPAVLPALAADLPRNRLGLARWLVSRENPLTARVIVNRFWQHFFGTGLVRTSEDFGSQGEPPSHPELLDWLAVTFQESGWDVKKLVKLIVTSETYQQSSQFSVSSAELDPMNRLLSRGPRHRLSAEVIRDQALAASGLLVEKIGGPSVKPYHPPGLYEQVVAQRDNPKATYQQGSGDDLHRRSLYTYWKRSVPHPGMLLFDAPFRETCALRRSRSNTPLQALNLMNDPTYVEAARFLAQRMIKNGGTSIESRLTHGFGVLLARKPRPQELQVLTAAVERSLKDFAQDPEAAKQLLTVGEAKTDDKLNPVELAAYTTAASTLINLDETITKE